MPDLVAAALAQGDVNGAMRLLQNEKDRGSFSLGDTSLSTYLLLFERVRGQSRSTGRQKYYCDQQA